MNEIVGHQLDGWSLVRLGDVLRETNEKARGLPVRGEGVPVLSITMRHGLIPQEQKFGKRVAGNKIGLYKVVRAGQIVCGFPLDEGVIDALRDYELGIVSPAYTTWEVTANEVNPVFLAHALRTPSMCALYNRLASRTVHRRRVVKKQDFLDITVRLPKSSEQRAILRLVETIRRAIEAQDKVIAAARELKRSLIKHLFTYGPISVVDASRVPLKETEIGPVPEHWETIPFGSLVADGPQNGLYKPQSLYGAGTPIVRINDYENEGGVVTSAENRVQLTQEEVATLGLRRADILVNRVNSLSHLGKAALVGEISEPTVFESNMMRFAVDTARVLPEYVFRFLCTSSVREHFRGKSKRAVAQSSINQQDVRSLPTPLPSLREQHEIVASLSAAEQKIAAEEKRKTALQALFNSMLHHLMTGKIRVPEAVTN
jgi:type I restriction enzyme, S subunit